MASRVLAPGLTLCASVTLGALASSAMLANATTSLQGSGLRFFIFGVSSQINQVGRTERATVCGLNPDKSRHRRVAHMLPPMCQKTRILQDIIPREIRHFLVCEPQVFGATRQSTRHSWCSVRCVMNRSQRCARLQRYKKSPV